MSKEVLEGEVVESKSVSREKQKPQPSQFKFPAWQLLASLVPVFGFIFALGWLLYENSNKSVKTLFAILGLVISIFSTITFLVLKFIIKAIF